MTPNGLVGQPYGTYLATSKSTTIFYSEEVMAFMIAQGLFFMSFRC